MSYSSLSAIQAGLHAGSFRLQDLVADYLQKMEHTASLNAYIEVFAEEAMERARQLDERRRLQDGRMGRLHGMVLSVKDNICFKGHRASAGSRILENHTAVYHATAVERLLQEEAIIIGRTNCDEFGMGSTNEYSYYGAARHPQFADRIPGGSSGGAAISVATDTCLAALGSDTGGSIRQPAGFCGILGLKPTYGGISRHGLIAYGSSFDQIGILARDTEDIRTLLDVISGPDDYDATALQERLLLQAGTSAKARIAYFRDAFYHSGLHPSVRAISQQWLAFLESEGHSVAAVNFDYLDVMIPAYYILTTAEASSNLSRYDGVRYGYRSPGRESLKDMYTHTRTEGFGKEVKRRIMLGTYVLSAGYYDAYYAKAQQVRRLIRDRTMAILREYDFIISPVSPVPPWKIGERADDPVANYLADIFTVQANMSGIPALAFPGGFTEDGLPTGMQLMSAPQSEGRLLDFTSHILASPAYRDTFLTTI